MLTVLGLLVYSVIQRQVRLYLRTHDQQLPGKASQQTQRRQWYWPCLHKEPWSDCGSMSKRSCRSLVFNPSTDWSVTPWASTLRGMQCPEPKKAAGTFRLLERGARESFAAHWQSHIEDHLTTPLHHAKDWRSLFGQCPTATFAFEAISPSFASLLLYSLTQN